MKIAICDDSAIQRGALAEALIGRADLELFGTAAQLLKSIQGGEKYAFILLDVSLTGNAGAALAKAITTTTDIIFMSPCPRSVTEAFRFHTSHFLLKPFTKETLLRKLDQLAMKREKEAFTWHIAAESGAKYWLRPSEIIYIDTYRNNLNIQTIQDRISIVGRMSDADQLLSSYHFGHPYQGILVNLQYVEQINQWNLICTPDYAIPISIQMRTKFLREYAAYIRQRQQFG